MAPDGAEVVLDVAARTLGGRGDGLDRPLALELAQELLVRAVDDVRENVQAATVRHADHDLVRAGLGCELNDSSSIGTSTSSPSIENCFCPRKARRR